MGEKSATKEGGEIFDMINIDYVFIVDFISFSRVMI